MTRDVRARLQGAVTESPVLGPILRGWDRVALPNAWLAAGAVVQTYWNAVYGLKASHGIRDIDIV